MNRDPESQETEETSLAPFDLMQKIEGEMDLPNKFRLPEDVAEEYRKLRNNILMNQSIENLRSICAISCVQEEGATTVATNLAVTMAVDGPHRVLLVDGNMHHPSLHRVFRIQVAPGFLDVLMGEGTFASVVRKSPIPTLGIIPVGRMVSNPTKLIDSDRLLAMIEFFKGRFDYIIFDASPLLPFSDGRILAKKLDGTILIVLGSGTRLSVVQKAKKQLQNLNINLLGVILNRRRHFIPELIYRRL